MLTKRYQMISLLTHMADHMEVSGIGLRQLCDWAVTIHRFRNDIGEEDIALLERCGLLRYASVMTRVCEKYLSLPAFEWHHDIEKEIVDVVNGDTGVGQFSCEQIRMARCKKDVWPSKKREARKKFHCIELSM